MNPLAWLHARGITTTILAHAGIVIKPNGDIAIPIKDERGATLFWKYRRCPVPEDPNRIKYWYDNGSKSALYGLALGSISGRDVIVCEGELDCLLLWSKGFPAVTGTGGAGTWNKDWNLHLLSARSVTVLYDNDDAGREGSKKAARAIPGAKVAYLPVTLPVHADVTDFFLLGGTSALLREVLAFAGYPPAAPRPLFTPRIKGNVDVSFYENQLGPPQLRVRTIWKWKCPLHLEKTPSFCVYLNDGHWHCYGCAKGGSPVWLLMLIKGITAREAVKEIEQYTI